VFEHHAHVRVAKLQRHGFLHDGRGRKLVVALRTLLTEPGVEFRLHLLGQCVGRILHQHAMHPFGRLRIGAALHHAFGFLQDGQILAVLIDLQTDLAYALIGRIDVVRLKEVADRFVEL